MSEDHLAKTTRRDFLGTATIATAATLTVPVASEAQRVSTSRLLKNAIYATALM
jgi:Ubiquitinol-cytochrome C reductase Fe-S subunit TAT signal